MKKKSDLGFLLSRILETAEENLLRLDQHVNDSDGIECPMHELIENKNETNYANYTRLKTMLLSLARDNCRKGGISERIIIELLIEGYTEQEIASRYKSKRSRINNILMRFRQRLTKQKMTQYLLLGKYKT